jgi:ergothioneine biosynthesis protein EgtB
MRSTTVAKTRTVRKATNLSHRNTSLDARYTAVRSYSDYICEPLTTEDYVVQPNTDVGSPKWHLAHTTCFFEEFILVPYYKNYRRFHPRFSLLFNGAGGSRQISYPNHGSLSRPTVEEVFQYRAYVDEHMHWLLQDLPQEALSLFDVAISHEQQHQELLYTDIKFILGSNPLFPAYRSELLETPCIEHEHDFIGIPEGRYTIGYRGKGFAYDNERAAHTVIVRPFSIRKSLVTNGEYMQFMQAGGYQHPQYWHSDGWVWVKENRINSPLYWHFIEGSWWRYAMSGMERLNREEPVTHISFYEAAAFAEWKGMRLPTEVEWEVAADEIPWGLRWEHTNSAYLPYPGYEKTEASGPDYDGKFMINTMVLRGASAFTPQRHSRKTYRSFLNPHVRYRFTGIRLSKK